MKLNFQKSRRLMTAMAVAGGLTTALGSALPPSTAYAQEPATTPPRELRQEARQETQENRQQGREAAQEARQDARQGNPQATRQDARQEARQQRAQQRMNNRSQYFGTAEDEQFNNWVNRNNVPPMQRVARAAGAAVDATEAVINSASNLANRAGANASYGFDNPNPNRTNEWFYDYYSLAPTSYSTAGNSQRYGSASRFYDLNNDGVYDSLRRFRDSGQSGRFDAYDRIDFFSEILTGRDQPNPANATAAKAAAGSENTAEDDAEQGLDDAHRYTISGKIFATKTAKVNGSKNLVARLSNVAAKAGDENSNQAITLVDLGPIADWKSTDFKEGDAVTASGALERVGDKQILIADTATVGEERQERISRSAPKIEGQVVDVNKTQIGGKEHTMVIIDAESKRQIVDLGPSENLKAQIQPQTKITVVGVPVRMRNHSVVLAERATIGDQEIEIQRW